MVSHDPSKFDDHRHFGSRNIMFLVVIDKYSTFSSLKPPLLFTSKANGMKKHMTCHINRSNRDHMFLG